MPFNVSAPTDEANTDCADNENNMTTAKTTEIIFLNIPFIFLFLPSLHLFKNYLQRINNSYLHVHFCVSYS